MSTFPSVAALLLAAPGMAQGPFAIEELEVGPHPVGYRSSWELDAGRTFRTRFDAGATYGGTSGAARPVLVNLWYPADPESAGEPMPYGGYFELSMEPAAVAPLADALGAFAFEVAALELTGSEPDALPGEVARAFDALLAAPTACRRDATPARGPFPLVVYHSGAQSSYEDNAPFCELLASHGYVVVGSAFIDASGDELSTDGGEGSLGDLELLVRVASELPFVDARRIAGVGHSLGAQALLRWGARPDCAADALVLLDTTQDYYAVSMPMHDSLETAVLRGARFVEQPLLVAAGPGAFFELVDALTGSDRTYLVVPELDHNDFIAQGVLRLGIQAQPGAAGEHAARVQAMYVALCESVLLFLDAQLLGEEEPWAERRHAYAANPPGDPGPHIELAPAGTDGPRPYDPEGEVPPTPRQLLRLARSADAASTRDVLARFADHEPRGAIYDSSMALGSLVHELVERGDVEGARLLTEYLDGVRPGFLRLFGFLADFNLLAGHVDVARRCLEIALLLNPGDAAAAARLAELDD